MKPRCIPNSAQSRCFAMTEREAAQPIRKEPQ
jgi:hypothetical protein